MHIRRSVNLLIQRSNYQIVKVLEKGEVSGLPPESLLDDRFLASRIMPGRKHAWLVAAPKSGSTWLSVMLEILLGWRKVPLWRGSDRREQEPDARELLRFPRENIFSPHQHCRASESTVELINQFRIKSIIQVRNIYDSVISFREHCLNEGLLFSMAYIDQEFLGYDNERQLQFIIDMILPWYFSFYVSWCQAEGLTAENKLLVNYDELLRDTQGTLGKILEYLGESRSPAEIERAMAQAKRKDTVKNKAVIGRGNIMLNELHKAKIRELRQYYSHIDFSSVGL